MRRPLLAALSLLILSSCAGEVPYTNPSLPRKAASKDYASCRRYADSMTGTGAGGGFYDDERSTDAASIGDRSVSRREIAGIIDSCMRDKGYFPTKN